MDQPRKVAKPARGQLNREIKCPCRCIRGKYITYLYCCLHLFVYIPGTSYRGNYYYDLSLRPRKTQRVNSTTPRSRRFLKRFPIFSNRRHVFRRLCPIRGPFIALRQCRRRVNSTTPRSRYRGQDFFSVYPICNSAGVRVNTQFLKKKLRWASPRHYTDCLKNFFPPDWGMLRRSRCIQIFL